MIGRFGATPTSMIYEWKPLSHHRVLARLPRHILILTALMNQSHKLWQSGGTNQRSQAPVPLLVQRRQAADSVNSEIPLATTSPRIVPLVRNEAP